MKGRVLAISPVILTFLASCGGYDSVGLSDKNSAAAKRYEILQAIDEGNYDHVIQILSNDATYGGAFTQDEGRFNLAAAYVGKAGFDVNDVVSDMINTVNNNNDDFQTFIKALSTNVSFLGTLYLSKASSLYSNISPSCNPSPSEDLKKDACFYKGVVDIATAAVSINTIVKDVNEWLNPQGCANDANSNGVGDEADASACTIEYAANGTCTILGTTLTSINTNLTFTDSEGNNYSFELVRIDVAGGSGCMNTNTFYRLIDNSSGTLAVTEGLCDTNFNPCSTLDPSSGCYPCPVVDNGNVLDITETIVNTIESSQQIIQSLVQGTDAEQAVNDFITEVCGDKDCTESEIASYLQ